MNTEKEKYAFDPLGGDKWFPKETWFESDMKEYWGDWGISSEYDTLKAVLMHRPGAEIDNFDFREVRFRMEVEPEKLRAQHDGLADFYRSQGIKVYYVENQRTDRPNAIFCRDLLLMTPEGAIVCRPAMAVRRGEETAVARTVANLGIPVIKTINADGYFEGANIMWVDRETVVLAVGARTNRAGAEQVETELRRIGVKEVIYMQTPCGQAHIDGVFNIAGPDIVYMYPSQVPYSVSDVFRKKGYKILECPDTRECKEGFGVNFVAIRPNEVVMPAGNPVSVEILEKNGVKVHTVPFDEVVKAWGGMHCCTAFLKRG